MSFALIAILAAAAPVDCDRVQGAIARDECLLRESQEMSGFDCQDPQAQAQLNVCSWRDYLRADIELNRSWSQLQAQYRESRPGVRGHPQSQFGLLLDAQRAWLSYRDKHCDGEAEGFAGGTMQPLIRNSCRTRITRNRTAELKQIVEDRD